MANSQGGIDQRTRSVLAPEKVRREALEAGRSLHPLGLGAGNLSELSLRLTGDVCLANPAGVSYLEMTLDRFCLVSLEKEHVLAGDAPPRRMAWHRAVYLQTNARAVVLCQLWAALVVAAQGRLPDPRVLPGAAQAAGGLGLAQEDAVETAVTRWPAVLVPGSGLLVWAASPGAALARAEAVQRWCEAALHLAACGGER
ncbi:MAG: class II aldolase/adducin family protein [Anaerolineaceae bacterium]|nr:class II aldolase/adducin family protein [Anaerolineaceae bacterium]